MRLRDGAAVPEAAPGLSAHGAPRAKAAPALCAGAEAARWELGKSWGLVGGGWLGGGLERGEVVVFLRNRWGAKSQNLGEGESTGTRTLEFEKPA